MPGKGTRWVRVAIGGLVGILVMAWWWPGLGGDGGSNEVVISSQRSDAPVSDVILRRLREEGFTTTWEVRASTDCSIPSPRVRGVSVFIIMLPASEVCDPVDLERSLLQLERRGKVHRILAVVSWQDKSDSAALVSLSGQNVKVVDPRPLVGTDGSEQPCLWWDDCGPSGRVTTVDDGELTQAGRERLARFIVSGVL